MMFLGDKDSGQVVKTNHYLSHHYLSLCGRVREKGVSAPPKAISEVVKEFEQSLENLRPSTRRIYVAGAKAAIRCAHLEFWQCPSTGELLASLGESPTEKKARISPFLNFLGGGELKELVSDEDSTALQNWVIQTLAKRMRSVKNPSITTRRDLGLIAALCAAPARGTPRKWPENSLTIKDREALLWDVAIEEPCFAISLRFWHAWRQRLARPDQRRLYRKSFLWGQSRLLFPGPNGAPLSRAALHNAFRRLGFASPPDRIGPITPEKIRAAFLCGDRL
jgi:hypothetical protein